MAKKPVADETPKPYHNLLVIDPLEQCFSEAVAWVQSVAKGVSRGIDEATEKGGRSPDLIALYRRLYDAEEQIKEATKALTAQKELFKYKLLPEAFEREQISTLTTAERDRVTISTTVRASIPAPQRQAAYAALRESGNGDLIQETVNASTLSAWVKAEMEELRPIPEMIKVDTVDAASLTRGKR